MEWDEEIARHAKRWADNCRSGHDSYNSRRTDKFRMVGQNWAGTRSIKNAMQMWFDEYEDFNFDSNRCRGLCGHYTQFVWAKSTHLGCAYTNCPSPYRYGLSIVCNYGPGGNFNRQKPYQNGKACSSCPSGYDYCDNGLCSKTPGGGDKTGTGGGDKTGTGDKGGDKTGTGGGGNGKLTSDQMTFLDEHNRMRALVANGKIDGQPSSSNMIEMQWDDEIAKHAQRWADKCQSGHDSYRDRRTSTFRHVGQNWAGTYDIKDAMRLWFEEYKDYRFEQGNCFGVCGHYTQLVWAKSTHVGCAYTKCAKPYRYGLSIVCNYGPAGNFNREKPYLTGNACSNCPNGYSKCNDGLCSKTGGGGNKGGKGGDDKDKGGNGGGDKNKGGNGGGDKNKGGNGGGDKCEKPSKPKSVNECYNQYDQCRRSVGRGGGGFFG